MATVYWAWYWPSGDRRSYKQRFDPICAMPILAMLRSSLESPDDCAGCHERITGDADVQVWWTLYLPGREREDWSLLYDAACFERDADRFTAGADRLLDRTAGGGGPPAPSTRVVPWETIGLHPTEST